jgi:hypothetical protein
MRRIAETKLCVVNANAFMQDRDGYRDRDCIFEARLFDFGYRSCLRYLAEL